MKKPTEKQIAAELANLRAIKPTVPARTFFGDNNHESIDVQIRVLEERLTHDQIYDKFEPTGDGDIDHDEGRSENLLSAAEEAERWRDGESKESPSEGWKPAAIKPAANKLRRGK